MTENEILQRYLTTLYESQSEMCRALGLDKKSQPRFSQAFKGEKHSLALIVRICEEKRVLSRFFLQGIAQIFKKKDEEIIDTDIEEVQFSYLSKNGEWEKSWDDEKKLPEAVKVKISYFEPFVINIRMGMDKKEDDAGLGQT